MLKPAARNLGLFYLLRSLYYRVLRNLSEVRLIDNFTGFGLYDRKVIEILREFHDPYPYFRGLIAEIGFDIARIEFDQPRRKRGFSKNNFYTLYDTGHARCGQLHQGAVALGGHVRILLRGSEFPGRTGLFDLQTG